MASAPDITFRSGVSPYASLSTVSFTKAAPDGYTLPILFGENSDVVKVRVYNNYALNAAIASATNVHITTFDNASPGSHTATKSVTSQNWIRVYEDGYGESKGIPGILTAYLGTDTAVGGEGNTYIPEIGSAASTTPQIRAGADTNGVGFIEFSMYSEVPDNAGFATYSFCLSVEYDWVP